MFLLCGEGLSSLMRLTMNEGLLREVKVNKSGPQVSHLLFADDCILFSETSSRGANVLKEIIRKYRRCSGQCVNFDKSTVFFSKNTPEIDRNLVVNTLGVRCSNDPERYLGLPNMVGRKKRESFQILKDRIKQRIDHWSTRHLSQGGNEVFIKTLEKGYSLVCVEKVMYIEGSGGLGFRNMSQFNIAMLAKQGWRLINYPNSLLARVLKAKYYPNSNFFNTQLGNLPSLTWRSIWTAKGLPRSGMGWKVGRGTGILVWEDHWIPRKDAEGWSHKKDNEIKLVSNLIDATNNVWKTDLVENTFPSDIAQKILQIPWRKIQEMTFRYGRESFLESFRSEVLINYYKMLAWILITY
ncbi:reverse transcriptase [Gossypium australe]|uniref:Reverse transcriptase n=1 Tax=Gossypium australe TaxID=47621 RepID=A0A5B6X6R4_9ROSI|nr:reverse transcriptase [Gossypium australe]